MLRFNQIIDSASDIYSTLTLARDQRIKSRLKLVLDNGEQAGLMLPRGSVLHHGDQLLAETGQVVLVQAALEQVSSIYFDHPLKMARACYHLGNRHVPVQIGIGFIRYLHDHVLDQMLIGMGLEVIVEQASFEPEDGAYAGQHHGLHQDAH